MTGIALQLEYSVEAEVASAFAWKLRTDVSTWNDPPARFALDGPFEAGSCGTTILPDQEPLTWRIREVRPTESFILEMQLDRAELVFEWYFNGLDANRTKLTQRIVLFGENAAAYVTQVEAGFAPNLAPGMERPAAEMVEAQKAYEDSVSGLVRLESIIALR